MLDLPLAIVRSADIFEQDRYLASVLFCLGRNHRTATHRLFFERARSWMAAVAFVAQLVERRIRNAQVISSSLIEGFKHRV
jgi:hypothetical protein